MAEQTYTVTVASGDLYGGGTGNVYYLDGARNATGPGTVSWVNGGTLRFEQSDASNNNHPLIFSTTTSKDQYLTSGVTYYLDGASNYAAYINTSTFNAASSRYVEVTPSSETDFYYLCYVHGIGMGGIFDITQSTYGALKWGQGNWNAQNNIQVIATGQSANSNIGTVTAEGVVELGWGGDTWSENNWGDLEDEVATVTGVSAQTSVNSLAFAGATEGWGRPSWNLGAWGVSGDVLAQGQQLNSSQGSVVADGTIEEGWGRKTWGNEAWGETFAVALTGQAATTAIGTAIGKSDFSIQLSGLTALSLSLSNNYSIQIDNNSFVNASEATLNTTVGSVQQIKLTANVPVTGLSASTSVGDADTDERTDVNLSGIQASLSLGNFTLVQTNNQSVTTAGLLSISQGSAQQASVYPVTTAGLLNSSAGSTTQTTTANVTLTGIGLTASLGTVNITAWSEIDLGVNNTWSEVDLAA